MNAAEMAAQMQRSMNDFVSQHHWYVELVVRSKLLEQLSDELPDEELAKNVRLLKGPMDEEFLQREAIVLVGGGELLAWRGPRFDAQKQTFVMDYWR